MGSLYLSKLANGQGVATISGASNMNIENVGRVTGTVALSLSETAEGTQSTVFDISQNQSGKRLSIDVAGTDANYRFSGSGINATFNEENNLGYNVEINSVSSTFDFSGTESGAFVSTTEKSGNNKVLLGAGKQVLYSETLSGDLSSTGAPETRYYNNMVFDSGDSNVFLSSVGAQTRFETASTSKGAFMEGNMGDDAFYIGGSYGTFSGVAGNNLFVADANSTRNIMIGGVDSNLVIDNGTYNMYQGSYIFYKDSEYAGTNGNDTVRMFGRYGVARVDTSAGADCDFDIRGSYNAAFTGESATIDGEEYSYEGIMQGFGWTMDDFYSTDKSPAGYSLGYSSNLTERFLP